MEGLITDFDRDVYRKKISPFRDKLKEGGSWKYTTENGNKFSYKLKDGTNLDILEYTINKEDKSSEYDEFNFLLAEVNGVVVGFVSIEISTPKPNRVIGKSYSNVASIIKGLGIGGKLEATKNYLLQKEANKIGDIINVGNDENKETIETESKTIKDKFDFDNDKVSYLKRLKNLIVNRGNWLAHFGRDGKSGYHHFSKNGKDKFFKRFRKGDEPTLLNCEISKNETKLTEEADKIKW